MAEIFSNPPPSPFVLSGFPVGDQDSPLSRSYQLYSIPSRIIQGNAADAERLLPEIDDGGAWFGFFGFELCEWTEDIPPRPSCDWALPDLWFARFEKREAVNLPAPQPFVQELEPRVESTLSTGDHHRLIEKIKGYLVAGDIYQANLTVRFEAHPVERPWDHFLRLVHSAPVDYPVYVDAGDWKIISISPELFLRRKADFIETVPIKGTWERGNNSEEDRRLKESLLGDEKNRAELVMIVDLERNDLGRICRPGTVEWDEFPKLLSLSHLHHLCCPVRGRLRNNPGISEIIQSVFPGGSISGAPKRRALQILRELEPHRRGPFCGAIGRIHPNDTMLNLGIRTGVWKQNRFRFWAGGGIVFDSNPQEEAGEIRLKLKPLLDGIGVPLSSFWRD